MNAAFHAPLIVMMLLSGSSLNLPLSLPPLPADPVLANVAPEQCIAYLSMAGMDKANAASRNQVEQLLAEEDVQNFVHKLTADLKTALIEMHEDANGKQLAEEGSKLVESLLTRPMCVYLGSISPGTHGPTVRGGLVVNLGDDAAATEASLNKVLELISHTHSVAKADANGWRTLPLPGDAPTVQWAIKDKYLIVGLGDEEAADLWARHQKSPPKWLTDLHRQLPIDRPAMVQYVNLQVLEGMLQMALTAVQSPQIAQDALETLGLTNAKYYANVSGLDKDGFASRTLIATEGPPTGLLMLLAGKPLDAKSLESIPADASFAVAARIEPEKILDTFIDVAILISEQENSNAQFQFNYKDLVKSLFDGMAAATGVHPKNDLAANLGDTWCIYNSPSDGGFVLTGLTLTDTLKDRQKIFQANDKLIASYRQEMAKLEAQPANSNIAASEPKVDDFLYRGQKIFFLSFPKETSPVTVSWCITDDHLVVGLFPQTVKAYLDRQAALAQNNSSGAAAGNKNSLASLPQISSQFSGGAGPAIVTYCDTPSLFKLAYPALEVVWQYGMSAGGAHELNASTLPGASAILPHLMPDVMKVTASKDGVAIESHGSMPMGLLAAAPLLPAMGYRAALPRQIANENQAMNNLRLMGLGLLNYEDARHSLPPAVTKGKDGKPLLSWRVAILPYLEQGDLYNQFHLDEPWDSEHNKPLIDKMPDVYKAPGSKVANEFKTVYQTVRANSTAFPGEEAMKLASITDGTSRTVGVVETTDDKAVVWTKPDDFELNDKDPTAGLVALRSDGFLALFLDAHVQKIPGNAAPESIQALFTRNGGEVVDPANLPRQAPRAQVIGNGQLIIANNNGGVVAVGVGQAVAPAVPLANQNRKKEPKFPLGPEGDRIHSTINLKQIGLAMMVHIDAKKFYPSAYTADPEKKPLLSWRVAILPFLEENDLYRQFHLDEPWDSEHNKQLIEKMPDVFKAPGSKAAAEFKTVYLTPRGDDTVFPGDKGIRIKDITDGTSKTIMVVEANDDKAVVWTKPDDFDVGQPNPVASLVGLREGGFLASFCDGSVHCLSKDIDLKTLLELFDRHDGQAVDNAKFEQPLQKPPPPAQGAVQLNLIVPAPAPTAPPPPVAPAR